MGEGWKALADAGVPLGPPRAVPSKLDFGSIRAALDGIDPAGLDDVERVALLAWLQGWQGHWPSRFRRELGDRGDRLLSSLASRPFDRNRYLKLRRIAVENLAAVL